MTTAHDLAREVLRLRTARDSSIRNVIEHARDSHPAWGLPEYALRKLDALVTLAEAVLRECPPAPDTAASGVDVGVGASDG